MPNYNQALQTNNSSLEEIITQLNNMPDAGGDLQDKTVTPTTSTQIIAADDGYDGLNTVTIEGDTNLVADNIKNGVSIFGVSGTYEGSGGEQSGASSSNDKVCFYDYDGTLLHAYALEEAQALTELPELPTHEGLICQGWNYDLETLKSYDRAVNVGATYITDDGKTRLYIRIAAEGRMNVPLYFSQTVSNGVVIDWGDGSETETFSGAGQKLTSHTYTDIGDYVIEMDVVQGALGIVDSSVKAYRNMLQKVELGNGVTKIGSRAFQYCYSLTSITIPNGVTDIDSYAFQHCYSLTGIIIPSSVKNIASYVFQYCYSLVSVVIPNGITKISYNIFDNCRSLTNITLPNNVTQINEGAFSNCNSLVNIVIPDGVTSIIGRTFCACYALTSVIIPDSVTSIGPYAFQNCYSLTHINIPNGVTLIPDYAFQNCCALVNINIPDGVTSIGSSAFSSCHSLVSITIPSGVTNIGGFAFSSCYSLANIIIPNGVTSIGSFTFQYCYSLTSVIIPDGITSIKDYAFADCNSLASINISDSVTSIGGSAFIRCYSLASITIPEGVTSISSSTWGHCNGMAIYDFSNHTSVPTLASTDAFKNIPSDCIIKVPATLYDEWITATNWATYASQIVAKEELL